MVKLRRIVLELKNVSKRYLMGETYVDAIKDVSLRVHENEFISIIGPSGSGKSTLLSIMGLLTQPTHGAVFIDGINVSNMNKDKIAEIRGKKIGFVFQSFNLIPSLTVLENVTVPMMFLGVNRREREERAKEIIREVGLSFRMYHFPNQLSGGERQRVAIARALANDPSVILADEPTGNLDSQSGEEIVNIFKNLHRKGRTMVMVTHDEDIAHASKKLIHIKDGTISKTVSVGNKRMMIEKQVIKKKNKRVKKNKKENYERMK
ncbi:ABC transporter ATP-binding protein [Candidatus Micrarchaeota archaeon]|nr:ABC transporter ATP-binding protein [Candidatus Micrarchaeota archaeon]